MVQLEIYVSGHCFGCPEARRLAAAVAERFNALAVRVVDLDVEPAARPERVIAVPAYVLADRVISLGNPRQVDLFGQVERALAAEQADRW